MKRGWKIFWIICASVMGCGFVCCIAALILGVNAELLKARFPYGIGWVMKSGSVEYEEDVRERFSDICKINADVHAFAGELRFELSDVEQVTVETEHIGKDIGFSCTQDGEELKLKTKSEFLNRNIQGEGIITVYLPENLKLEELEMELGAGYLYMDGVCADELQINAGAGEAELEDICAGEAEIETGAGKVTAGGVISENIKLKVGVGCIDYTAAGCEEDYDYEIQGGVGTVKCGDSEYSGLSFEKVIDNHAGRKMSIDCGVGSVKVQFDKDMRSVKKEEHHHGN